MHDDARIAKLLGQLRDAVAEQVTQLNRSLEVEEQAVAARVEERRRLASQLQLPEKLLTIYKEVKYYPHWIRNNPADVCRLVTDVEVNKESIHNENVRFLLKGRCYSFVEDLSYADDGRYVRYSGSFTLTVASDETLFKLWVSLPESGEYRVSKIAAFVPDDWILDFMELSQAITTIAIERDRRHRQSEIERQKRDFGLGVSEPELQRLQAALGRHDIGEDQRSAGTTPRATGGWLRRLFGRRHDGESGAT